MKKQSEVMQTYRLPSGRANRGGPGSAGQSGDTQGLPDSAQAGSASVQELVEEGQFFEAEVLMGVEEAADPDVSEVRTKEVPQDDVPGEYNEKA